MRARANSRWPLFRADEGITLDTAALSQFLRERLADYKLPRQIMILPGLPRNATGKMLKTHLRQMFAAGQLPGGASGDSE